MQIYYTDGAASKFGSILLYGEAGAGKTPMAATLPDPIILTSEPGLVSLQHLRLPYVLARDMKEANAAIEWVTGSAEARKYQSVFFDSISALSEANMIINKRNFKNDARKWAPGTISDTMETVAKFLAIPGKHRVMTCKAMNVQISELPPIMRVEPHAVLAKLGPLLPYHFDVVAFMSRGRNERGEEYAMFTCRDNDRCHARDRSGRLALYEPADLTNIIRKSTGVI